MMTTRPTPSSPIPLPPPVLASVVIFVIVAATFISFGWMLARHNEAMLRTRTSITGQQIALRLEQYINSRIAVLDVTYGHWSDGSVPTATDFQRAADEIRNAFPEFQAINWVDPDHVIRWVTPEASNPGVRDADLRQHPTAGPCIARAGETGRAAATPPIALLQGGHGFALYLPIGGAGAPRGFVNGVFRVTPLLDACFSTSVANNFDHVIIDGAVDVDRSRAGAPDDVDLDATQWHDITVADRTWHLALTPKPHQQPSNAIALAIAGTGLIVAFALGLGTRRLLASIRGMHDRTREVRAIYEAFPDVHFRLAADGTIIECQGRCDLLPAGASARGRPIDELLTESAGHAFRAALTRLARTRLEQFVFGMPEDAPTQHFEARLVPFRDGETILVVRDVTERIDTEQRQRRLMTELDHRVKNTLSAVLSLSDQTAMTSRSLPDFRTTFTGRVRSLAQTHDALAARKWSAVGLRETIVHIVCGDAESANRIHLDGDETRLYPESANPICLTLHELKTNALKYGALSVDAGTVDISWGPSADGASIVLEWRERGGPPIDAAPTPGLGLTLIRGFVEHELAGAVTLTFAREGLTCRLDIPRVRPWSAASAFTEHDAAFETSARA